MSLLLLVSDEEFAQIVAEGPSLKAHLPASEEHPALLLTDIIRHQMRLSGIKDAEEVAKKANLSNAMATKLCARSLRRCGPHNSGRLAKVENIRRFARLLSLNWAVAYLALLSIELPGAKRRKDGGLCGGRDRDAHMALHKLRLLGVDGSVRGEIERQVDGHSSFDEEPFRAMVCHEAARLGYVL